VKAMTGQHLWNAARDGDAAKVSTLCLHKARSPSSTTRARMVSRRSTSRPKMGMRSSWRRSLLRAVTSIFRTTGWNGAELRGRKRACAVSTQLLAARCNVDVESKNGATALQFTEGQGHPESPR
jgi:hypothetical protein